MTEVLTLILLVYPGALVDVIYNYIARERIIKDDSSEIMQMAKYFVWSGCISVTTLTILSFHWKDQDITGGIYGALNALATGWNSIIYIILSMALVVIFVLIRRFIIDRATIMFKQKLTYNNILVQDVSDPWQHIMTTFDLRNTICKVYKDNEMVSCGVVKSITDDFEKSKSLVLIYGDTVREALEIDQDLEESERYIGHLVVEYCSLETGYSLKFYKADNLAKELSSSPSH